MSQFLEGLIVGVRRRLCGAAQLSGGSGGCLRLVVSGWLSQAGCLRWLVWVGGVGVVVRRSCVDVSLDARRARRSEVGLCVVQGAVFGGPDRRWSEEIVRRGAGFGGTDRRCAEESGRRG